MSRREIVGLIWKQRGVLTLKGGPVLEACSFTLLSGANLQTQAEQINICYNKNMKHKLRLLYKLLFLFFCWLCTLRLNWHVILITILHCMHNTFCQFKNPTLTWKAVTTSSWQRPPQLSSSITTKCFLMRRIFSRADRDATSGDALTDFCHLSCSNPIHSFPCNVVLKTLSLFFQQPAVLIKSASF